MGGTPLAMRAAITGAAGFVGSHLARELIDRGHEVRAVIRESHDASGLHRLGADVARADVRDAEALTAAFDDCDAVVHLAALTTRRHASASAYEAVNVGGTRAVTEAVERAGVEHLVLGSTVGVYGMAPSGAPPRPNTPYRRSKWMAERIVHAADVPATAVRLPATLGPGTANWLGWVQDIAAGRFRLAGDGRARKTLGDVADVARGLALATEAGGSGATYDLAGPGPVTVGALARLWADGVGAELRRVAVPAVALRALARLGDVADRRLGVTVPKAHAAEFFSGDVWHPPDAARRALGYAPRVSIPEAVTRTLDGFRVAGLLPASGSSSLHLAAP